MPSPNTPPPSPFLQVADPLGTLVSSSLSATISISGSAVILSRPLCNCSSEQSLTDSSMIYYMSSLVRIGGAKLARLPLLCGLKLWMWPIWLGGLLFLQKPRWLEPWPWGGFWRFSLSWLPWLWKLAVLCGWCALSGTKSKVLFFENWKLEWWSNEFVDDSLLKLAFLWDF